MNIKFIQKYVSDISEKLISDVIKAAKGEGHNNHAPLGCAGVTFILYGESRRKEISLRLHNGDAKLLVTDSAGGFLFSGGYDLSLLPINFIATEYYKVINNVEYLLSNTSTDSRVTEADKHLMYKSGAILNHLEGIGF
jgi:hypothetical protein